jgi:outer membrane lipoprotein SlyB
MKKIAVLMMLPALMLADACTTDIGANQYSSSSVGSVNRVVMGKIISVRQVQVRDDDRSAGTAVGAIAGGLAGSQVGKGNTATILGAVGGTLIGGAAGNMAQRGMSAQSGYEYVIQLDNGSIITIIQGSDILLAAGQRCMILYGDGSSRARVVPYNG